MDDLVQMARDLGASIRDSQYFSALRAAEKTIQADPDLSKMIEEYQNCAASIYKKEQAQEAVEPEEKHKLQDLQKDVSSRTELQELAKLQADYAELMNKVNSGIQEGLWPDGPEDASAEKSE